MTKKAEVMQQLHPKKGHLRKEKQKLNINTTKLQISEGFTIDSSSALDINSGETVQEPDSPQYSLPFIYLPDPEAYSIDEREKYQKFTTLCNRINDIDAFASTNPFAKR